MPNTKAPIMPRIKPCGNAPTPKRKRSLPYKPLRAFLEPRLVEQLARRNHMLRVEHDRRLALNPTKYQEQGYPQLESVESAETALMADLCNVTTRSIHRWAEKDSINLGVAEDVADFIGVHSSEVWGADYDVAVNNHDYSDNRIDRVPRARR